MLYMGFLYSDMDICYVRRLLDSTLDGVDRVIAMKGIYKNFADNRNMLINSINATDDDWLLFIDADEIVSGMDIWNLRSFINKVNPYIGGIELCIRSLHSYHGGVVEVIDGYLTRVIRLGRGYEYRGSIHEDITESIIEKGDKIIRNNSIKIFHYGYDLGRLGLDRKVSRNFETMEQLDDDRMIEYGLRTASVDKDEQLVQQLEMLKHVHNI